jgi:hypothetical protein
MAEWLKAAVLKTAFRSPERGFESPSLRSYPDAVTIPPLILKGGGGN